jgi:3-hydroxyacyl-CoA dehydrogenase/enoyl-CoA hydratase/3-hydroxybutyryl-CoA epimerase/enoyl-CoA isomerase
MIHNGNAITVQVIKDGIAELCFDLQGESVNKLNQATLQELQAAVEAIKADKSIKGLMVTSAKTVFIVGADITEFSSFFSASVDEIAAKTQLIHDLFSSFEDLELPKVVAINGLALGGGFEICLACEYRVISSSAQVGLPEVKLGIFPGYGGTVRLSRVIGIDNALEWIGTGAQHNADAALKVGAVDAVVAPEQLKAAALDLLEKAIQGQFDWQAKRQEKIDPIKLNQIEQMMAINSAKAVILSKANPAQYPAPKLALDALQIHVNQSRDEALTTEAQFFAQAAVTAQAQAMVGLFLNDQIVKKTAKQHQQGAHPVQLAAVLGAGIMGGGIAYQAAVKGTPIIMKDIGNPQLALGMQEANGLLSKQVARKKIQPVQMGETLARIRPALSYDAFQEVDIVIEAVTENPKVKTAVLAETEQHVAANTIIASNTSTISISRLAQALQRPENFVGMHFFNPVHMMPLVEVIRGEKTSEQAIATTVVLAQKMGKTPIVVNDCPGFLVNRVLFPYFGAFDLLLKDGADFQHIDQVMEKFGWPMGPAYLIDVVGIDTGVHGAAVMAEGFPDRMQPDFKGAIEIMYENQRLGQKNDLGFYQYVVDKKGKKVKTADAAAQALVATMASTERHQFAAQDIIDRMLLALCNETVRCLEDRIVATAAEADMAMIMGIGFPAFRGGPCRYIDQIGIEEYVALCDKYAALGKAYQAPQLLRDMAHQQQKFYA